MVACSSLLINSGYRARGSQKFRWLGGKQKLWGERVSLVGRWLRAIAAVAHRTARRAGRANCPHAAHWRRHAAEAPGSSSSRLVSSVLAVSGAL